MTSKEEIKKLGRLEKRSVCKDYRKRKATFDPIAATQWLDEKREELFALG